MATLKGSTIASTFDQLVQRATSYSQTGTNIELMDDTSNAVAKPTGLYLESGATTSNVGIGIAAPERLLHLYAANSGVTPHANTNLFIEDSANNYIEIAVPDGQAGGIYFSDVTSTSGSTGGTAVSTGTTKTAALTDDVDFIPYIGIEAGAAAAEAVNVHYTAISRAMYE